MTERVRTPDDRRSHGCDRRAQARGRTSTPAAPHAAYRPGPRPRRADDARRAGVAHADSALSFVHAVPGGGKATLQAGSAQVGEEGFAGVSAYRTVGSGSTVLTLKSADGKTLATKKVQLADGSRYAVVALLDGMKPILEAYPDAKPKAGVAKLRVVHAVPELGSPEIWVDGKKVMDKLDYRSASPYLTVKPGTHTYSAHRPGDGALLSGKLALKAGTVSTGFVVGSRGEKVRVVPALEAATTASPSPRPSTSRRRPRPSPSRPLPPAARSTRSAAATRCGSSPAAASAGGHERRRRAPGAPDLEREREEDRDGQPEPDPTRDASPGLIGCRPRRRP